jgi:hypothetical protein
MKSIVCWPPFWQYFLGEWRQQVMSNAGHHLTDYTVSWPTTYWLLISGTLLILLNSTQKMEVAGFSEKLVTVKNAVQWNNAVFRHLGIR